MRTSCPHCQKHYPIPASAVGRTTKCKACGKNFVIEEVKAVSNLSAIQKVDPKIEQSSDHNAEIINWQNHSQKTDQKSVIRLLTVLGSIVLVVCIGIFYNFATMHKAENITTSKPIESHAVITEKQNPATTTEVPKTVLSGGAWLTRQNGSSEIIRGLTIHVFSATTEKSVLSKTFEQFRKEALQLAEMCKKDGSDEYYAKKGSRELILKVTADAEELAKNLDSYNKYPDNKIIEIDRIYDFFTGLDRIWEQIEQWTVSPATIRLVRVRQCAQLDFIPTLIRSGLLVKSTKTGIDGKYSTGDLPIGSYCIYASYDTDAFLVHWLVKTNLVGAKQATLDLSLENAGIIINKPK